MRMSRHAVLGLLIGPVFALVDVAASPTALAQEPSGSCSALGAALPAEPELEGSLRTGGTLFWDGECVERVNVNLACELHRQPAAPLGQPGCWIYRFEVLEPGGRLRVAIDSATRGDFYVLSVRGPGGESDADGNAPLHPLPGTAQQYNRELSFENAATGMWEVRVTANDVEDWAFRLRAALQGPPPPEPDVLAPNLVQFLPYEFGFVAPANPNAGSAIDRQNPPGPPGTSCHPDEQGASHCLRFSAGVANVGDGPLRIAFDGDDRAFQHVYLSDDTPGNYADNEREGRFQEIEAGTAEFHAAHGHRHFADMLQYELFEVSEVSGPPPVAQGRRLTPLDEGSKHGVCLGAQGMGDWQRFDQDRAHTMFWQVERSADCDGGLALGKGWGDYYRWQRPDQYVPYDRVMDPDGTMRAGDYVLRVTVDANDRLVETKESDNASYAYIQVIDGPPPGGDRVVICERGLGKSPWDPAKRVSPEPFWWKLRTASQAPAEGEC